MPECEWWDACKRPAATTRFDPVRDRDTPCCGPCAEQIDRNLEDRSPRALQARAAHRRNRKHRG